MRKVLLLVGGVIFLVVVSGNVQSLPEYLDSKYPELDYQFLDVRVWQWCVFATILVIGIVAGAMGRVIARQLSILRDKIVPQPMSNGTRRGVCRAAGLLVGSTATIELLPCLRLREFGPVRHGVNFGILRDSHLQAVNQGVIVVAFTMLCYSYWEATCDTIAANAVGIRRAERLLVPMMRKFVQAIIVIMGILSVIAVFFGTKTLTGLVAGLGVTGVVVALAGKDSVENVFGSLTILFDMPFALEDYVRIDKVEGSVEEINLRSTRIRTIEDTLITLPNANLIRASVENFGSRRLRRQKLNVRLNFASDPSAINSFCLALREYLNEQDHVEATKTQVQLDDPTETSVGVIAIWFLDVKSGLEEAQSRSLLLTEVLRLKNTHGLVLMSLPVPDEASEVPSDAPKG